MKKPTIIVTPREDNADIRAYDEARNKLASGEEEMVPADVVDRLLSSENKIRVWREHRGMSARDLAAAAELSTAYLSQIETGSRDGSIDVLKRIAAALGVDLGDIA